MREVGGRGGDESRRCGEKCRKVRKEKGGRRKEKRKKQSKAKKRKAKQSIE